MTLDDVSLTTLSTSLRWPPEPAKMSTTTLVFMFHRRTDSSCARAHAPSPTGNRIRQQLGFPYAQRQRNNAAGAVERESARAGLSREGQINLNSARAGVVVGKSYRASSAEKMDAGIRRRESCMLEGGCLSPPGTFATKGRCSLDD